jgi:hypothetical protein
MSGRENGLAFANLSTQTEKSYTIEHLKQFEDLLGRFVGAPGLLEGAIK